MHLCMCAVVSIRWCSRMKALTRPNYVLCQRWLVIPNHSEHLICSILAILSQRFDASRGTHVNALCRLAKNNLHRPAKLHRQKIIFYRTLLRDGCHILSEGRCDASVCVGHESHEGNGASCVKYLYLLWLLSASMIWVTNWARKYYKTVSLTSPQCSSVKVFSFKNPATTQITHQDTIDRRISCMHCHTYISGCV